MNDIDMECMAKAVIIRDGARGRFLRSTLIEDAHAILERELPAWYEGEDAPETLSDEAQNDYFDMMNDLARDCDGWLFDAGYYVYQNDGYVIYKDLSEEAIDELSNI